MKAYEAVTEAGKRILFFAANQGRAIEIARGRGADWRTVGVAR